MFMLSVFECLFEFWAKKIPPAFKKQLCSRKMWLFYSLCEQKGFSQRKTQVPPQLFLMFMYFPCLCGWWTLSSLQKYCELYSVAATFAGVKKATRRASVCFLCSGRGRHLFLCSGMKIPDAPKLVREGKCSDLRSCWQCCGRAGILLVGQSKALEVTGERKVS